MRTRWDGRRENEDPSCLGAHAAGLAQGVGFVVSLGCGQRQSVKSEEQLSSVIAAGMRLRGEELEHGGLTRAAVPAGSGRAFQQPRTLVRVRIAQRKTEIGRESIVLGKDREIRQFADGFLQHGVADFPSGKPA